MSEKISGMKILERSKASRNIKIALCKHLANSQPSNLRLPPIRELAKDLGFGQSSLHQAIKELVSKGLLISRQKAGTFINASPEDFRSEQEQTAASSATVQEARHPFAQKWIQVLYYKSAQAERFFMEAADSFVGALRDLGLRITKEILEPKHSQALLQHDKPDVLVVINPTRFLDLTCGPSQILIAIGTSQHVRMIQQERFDLVAFDDFQGGVMAGGHLKRLGWNDVCFLGVHDETDKNRLDKSSRDRLDGLAVGLGHPIPPEWQIRCWNYDVICGAESVQQWLKLSPRPPVIFAVSDDLAFGFINGAIGNGLRPGRDYQIIGVDGQQLSKDLGVGTITTIGAPMAEMGKLAAKMLLERLSNPHLRPRRVLLSGDLIEGNTVVPASGQ